MTRTEIRQLNNYIRTTMHSTARHIRHEWDGCTYATVDCMPGTDKPGRILVGQTEVLFRDMRREAK